MINPEALHLEIKRAIQKRDLASVKKCIAEGADIHMRDSGFMCKTKGYNLIHWAIRGQNIDIFKYLIDLGVDYKAILEKEGNLLQFCIGETDLDIVALLLAMGFTEEEKKVFIEESLFRAAIYVHIEKIKYLLEHVVNLNVQNKHGDSFLHQLACSNDSIEAVKLVVKKGIDIELKNNDGETALDYAIHTQNKEVIQYLLEQGAIGDASAVLNELELFNAVERGDIAYLKEYLEKGGNIERKNKSDETLLHIALNNNHDEMVIFLVLEGANVNAYAHSIYLPIISAASVGRLDQVKLFLAHGADVNDWGDNSTVLTSSCYYGQYEVVEFLLDNGADINDVDAYGRTALHIARYECNSEIEELLLRYNPDLQIEDAWGIKAMDIG